MHDMEREAAGIGLASRMVLRRVLFARARARGATLAESARRAGGRYSTVEAARAQGMRLEREPRVKALVAKYRAEYLEEDRELTQRNARLAQERIGEMLADGAWEAKKATRKDQIEAGDLAGKFAGAFVQRSESTTTHRVEFRSFLATPYQEQPSLPADPALPALPEGQQTASLPLPAPQVIDTTRVERE